MEKEEDTVNQDNTSSAVVSKDDAEDLDGVGYKSTSKPNVVRADTIGNKKISILSIFLMLLLVGAIGYISYNKLVEHTAEQERLAIEKAVYMVYSDIFEKAVSCETIPLNNGSLSASLVAIECLSQEGQ